MSGLDGPLISIMIYCLGVTAAAEFLRISREVSLYVPLILKLKDNLEVHQKMVHCFVVNTLQLLMLHGPHFWKDMQLNNHA